MKKPSQQVSTSKPPDHRRAVLLRFSTLSVSNAATAGVSLIFFVLVGRWVAVSDMGLWTVIQTLSQYALLADFGAYAALQRDLPQLRSRGRHDEAARRVESGWFLASSAPLLLLGAGFLPLFLFHSSTFKGLAAGPLVSAALAAAMHLTLFSRALHYSAHRAGVVSTGNFIQCFGLLASLYFIHRGGFTVFLISYVVVSWLQAIYLRLKAGRLGSPRFDAHALATSFGLGLPLWVAALALSLLTSVDRWFVLHWLGKESLGHYFPAFVILSQGQLIPQALMMILYPILGERYARSGDARGLVSVTKKALLVLAGVLTVQGVAGWFLLPVIVRVLVPAYLPGLLAAQLMLVACFFLGLATVLSFVAITLHRHYYVGALRLICSGVLALIAILLLRGGGGLASVALSVGIASAVYCAALGGFVAFWLRQPLPSFEKVEEELEEGSAEV